MQPIQQQSPATVLGTYIDYLDDPTRTVIDGLYDRMLVADDAVLTQVLKGARKQTVKNLIDTDLAELNLDDYERQQLPPVVVGVVQHIVSLINDIDAANKAPGTQGVDAAMVALTDYVAGHPAEVGQVVVDGQPFGRYLHDLAGTDECNNVLASTVRPRLIAVAAGRPPALLVYERLRALKIVR